MEISDVRKRVLETIERSKRAAAERRTRIDEAAHEYELFLNRIVAPMFRQVASALRPENYLFTLFTPSGSVRLMSDRSAADYIEIVLDTSGPEPRVVGHASRGRGGRVLESETALGSGGPVRDLTELDVLDFVLKELAPFVER